MKFRVTIIKESEFGKEIKLRNEDFDAVSIISLTLLQTSKNYDKLKIGSIATLNFEENL